MLGSLISKYVTQAGFAALNRRDLDGFLKPWAEDAVFHFPGRISVSGEKKGKEEIRRFFQRVLEQFPTLHFDVRSICVEHPFVLLGSNSIAAEWMLDVINRQGNSFRYGGITLARTRRGQIYQAQDYLFDSDIIRHSWAETT